MGLMSDNIDYLISKISDELKDKDHCCFATYNGQYDDSDLSMLKEHFDVKQEDFYLVITKI